ncbi:MAG: hypothetical protein ACLVJ6_10485 [Merdibacter sp.]
MRKFWTLMRVQLKSGAIATTDGTTKQWKKLLLYLVLLVCMLPTLVLIAMLFYYGFDYMRLLDQAGYLMNVGFLMTAVIIFLFSIFAIPSVYFSKDIDHLLVLPIKPEVILTSKLAVCIVYEYRLQRPFWYRCTSHSSCRSDFHSYLPVFPHHLLHAADLSAGAQQRADDGHHALRPVLQQPGPFQPDRRHHRRCVGAGPFLLDRRWKRKI